MGVLYRLFSKPILSMQDSEKAHARALRSLNLTVSNPLTRGPLSLTYKPSKKLPCERFGIQFSHPFGMAAGMDKKAESIRGWEALGLGFTEIGGVTMLEQPGNPKPRMFRAGPSRALVNRMGFNNPGSLNITKSLAKHHAKYGKPKIPVWANLGKSKDTPLDEAHDDYATTLGRLWPYVDLFVINVSSPNTPNLRELQKDDDLARIIEACEKVNLAHAEEANASRKPILVKVAPDLDDDQLVAVVNTARASGCDGIVASNTTIARPDPKSSKEGKVFSETGGMSGAPVKNRSTEMISAIYKMTDGEWPIVGVGGIMNADDAWEKITAGACLLQAYSGFVFEGPALTKNVVNGLTKKLKQHGLNSIDEAVGLSHRQG